MRISINTLTGGLFVGAVLALASCNSLLEVEPRSNADLSTALTTVEGIDATLNGIYDRMQNVSLYGRDMLAVAEALADNAQATNKSGRLNSEARNVAQNTFGTAQTTGTWQSAYFAINQANLLLEATPKVTTLTDTNRRNSIMGQCYFLRGLLYHDLMRIYAYDPGVEIAQQSRGGVPIVLNGVNNQDQIAFPARASIADVYKQIYSDLQTAINLFGRNASNSASVPAYGNLAAAQELLSRVALYNKDYANAVKYATDAIGGSVKLLDATSYVAGWRAPRNPESVFELQFTALSENIGVNLSLQTTYTTLVRSGDRSTTGGFGDLVPTTAFLTDLRSETATSGQPADVRSQLYELGTTGRGTAFVECTKFLGKNGTINLDNVPILRISEAYLNRAEANFMLGNTADALTDLNTMRTNRGLSARTGLTGDALLSEILRQRRLEYAFEGHRWFDLKRRGQDVVKATAQGGGLPYNDYRILANIPVNEVSTNRNIRQNFGY
ncbi:RagB/SusD family nutrient uptake outer membrane protein [Spirosoma oryzicola]|uniref:RagB/SusD family nutrient uptake outer membrane protein n=1 Tax=Spirosoma oryzicola TaxID=2898794 RepID=UPI001E37C55B|nr:RagB/SusD family nutrient uptake outer membrane protein [Spirosoma oryzicola]UHG92364.1 RagB/SusD family nutrient uptake outer membrane protein [Spirosoma oryzicola]